MHRKKILKKKIKTLEPFFFFRKCFFRNLNVSIRENNIHEYDHSLTYYISIKENNIHKKHV